MSITYTALTPAEIEFLTGLELFNWTGPALPRPEGVAGLAEVFDTLERLVARGQYLIQAKDGFSRKYTLGSVTATAERFMLGTEAQVQEAADIRSLLLLIEPFLDRLFAGLTRPAQGQAGPEQGAVHVETDRLPSGHTEPTGGPEASPQPEASSPDYSALALENVRQFAMAWTTGNDIYRMGFPHVEEYAAAVEDPYEATRQFWPLLRSTALPYNLLVVQKLTEASAEPFRSQFGASWPAVADELLSDGRLFGIDMTLFTDLAPQELPNGTTRFTPNTMGLLVMEPEKTLKPLAVYVADPLQTESAQVYTEQMPTWTYALLALKTSLTVYGIWIGHVYTLHLVTAAMQMATWNELPETHVLYQLLSPHSKFTIPFDLLLLLGWSQLAPPTSISDPGKFLTLCNRFAETHDFFSTDPAAKLASLNLTAADFTDPAQGGGDWNLYPNVQRMQALWTLTEEYVTTVVQAAYPDDAAVESDTDLLRWIQVAGAQDGGNVSGLPSVLASRAALQQVATSILYRVIFHGLGRLRTIGSPEPEFAPNFPPCLQNSLLPSPHEDLSVSDLLNTYLPRTGTLGELASFYDTFAFNSPYKPLIPEEGSGAHLWFHGFDNSEQANSALIKFREGIEAFMRHLQPDWVHIGQWPRNIEL